MMKTKIQRGHIWRAGGSWFGRWRREELVTGADGNSQVERRQHAEKLCDYSDRYRTRRDVQPILDSKLQPLNDGRSSPESTLMAAAFADKFFFPHVERELKPSTVAGYKNLWRMYLRPRLGDIALRDFRCVDATNILAAIHRDHKVGRVTLQHCKALLSAIFVHALRAGALDGPNPAKNAGIPRAAEPSAPTHAYTFEEVSAMLAALTGVARTAVALLFFCGLRPGEARAARWEDYNGKELVISASMWGKHLTAPKTKESVGPRQIPKTLADILAESRRPCGYILTSPRGEPVDLHNLAFRVIRPALALCAECSKSKKEHGDNGRHQFKALPEWRGFYALRRGCATLATSVDGQMAAKSLLFHSNVRTTEKYYIKSSAPDAIRALDKIDALFQRAASAVPN